jgi:hypothetical protein
MEHIIQFGVTIDDDAIKKNIEKNAVDKLVEDIKKEVRNEIFVGPGWNRGLSYKVQEIIKEALAEYKDEIIKDATAELVDTMKRSKKYKEALAKIVEVADE